MKKVSIIIPAYNSEKTLMNCYNSILRQTYQNFEVVTINDGSTDNTKQIMESMSKKDNRFIGITIEQNGVSNARNVGVLNSSGKYLQFVDADDTLKENMLEKMITLIEKNNADLSICRFDHPFFKTYYENRIYDLTKKYDLLQLEQDPFGFVMPWNKVWKREKFVELFDVNEKFSEDELCNLSNLPELKRVATTDEVLYNYSIAPANSPDLQNSCIGRLITKLEYDNYHTSFYWLGLNLLSKRKAIIQKAIENNKLAINNVEDLCYYKLIDYSVYTLPAYIGMGVSKLSLIKDYLEIIDEPNFVEGFRCQEKFGFRLKNLTKTAKLFLIKKFINLCFDIYEKKHLDKDFKISYAFMSVFLSLFTEQIGSLDDVNLNAKLILDLKNLNTKEAIYVKGILENDIILCNYNIFVSCNSAV